MTEINISTAADATDNIISLQSTGKFYGWWMVLAGSVILFVSSGIGFYSHGVILDPLRTAHGWSKGTISSAITLYFFATGLMGIIIGRQIDKYGPRRFLIIGSIIFGLGFWSLSGIDKLWQLYASYLIMAIGFSFTSLIPVNTLITNWFIRKRGLAMSLANTGLSAGGVLLVPLASYLVIHRGLKMALITLGTLYGIVIIPTAIFFIKQRPSNVNQLPDGDLGEVILSVRSTSPLSHESQMRVWTRYQAMGTVAFWSITVAFLLALGGQIAYLVHQMSFLSQYIGPQGAALAVSMTAGASIVGRLFLGVFVDRCDKRYVIIACLLIQGLAIITLAYNNHIVILYLCTFAFGLTMGSIIMLQSLIVGECFGLVSFATISGVIGLFSMSGAAFGPMIAGSIFDAYQSYQNAFTLFAGASFLAMFVILFAKPPKQS
ncbi:MAG TPA: MFS transporter [Desulfobacterales bacterium]|nr:MFS transporter [Desulfobacterales bacterium]